VVNLSFKGWLRGEGMSRLALICNDYPLINH
jgi:hypothetical protein